MYLVFTVQAAIEVFQRFYGSKMNGSENLLHEEDCTRILKYHANSDSVYKSHTITILDSLRGLIGKHYKLKIHYEENGYQKEMNLFLKELHSTNKHSQYLLESIKAFEKEEFFYNYLMKEFRSNNVHVDFVPACYLCRPPLFVLEDLSVRGYRNAPDKDMLDVRHCKMALKSLAKFHSATLIYEKIKTDTDDKYVSLTNQFPHLLDDVLFGDTKNAASDWLECTIKGLLTLIDLLPESEICADKYKTKLIETLEMSKHSNQYSNHLHTILHGDLWFNNFMFKYHNGVPTDSILIDYQILKYGPIALDVVQMIMTNVRRQVRGIHFEELLSYYYHQFAERFEEYGLQAIDFVSYKGFLDSCEELKLAGKMQCVVDHSVTFLVDKELEETMHTEEGMRMLFEDRSRSMAKSYKDSDLYREIMTEDLIELRDLLFQT